MKIVVENDCEIVLNDNLCLLESGDTIVLNETYDRFDQFDILPLEDEALILLDYVARVGSRSNPSQIAPKLPNLSKNEINNLIQSAKTYIDGKRKEFRDIVIYDIKTGEFNPRFAEALKSGNELDKVMMHRAKSGGSTKGNTDAAPKVGDIVDLLHITGGPDKSKVPPTLMKVAQEEMKKVAHEWSGVVKTFVAKKRQEQANSEMDNLDFDSGGLRKRRQAQA